MSITFAVSGVELGPRRAAELEWTPTLTKLLHQPIEALSPPPGRLIACSDANMFACAIEIAYLEHRPLVISPDDVWLCIALGFAKHVNLHAEKLRSRFVRHEGKLKLVLMRGDFVLGKPNPWPEAFAGFSGLVAEHVGKLHDLLVADFSTTGPIERAASEVLLMDSFQAYFEYVMLGGCGIPSITLLGTPADWRSIRTRAGHLAEYELGWWTKALLPVLDELVKSAEGAPNVSFWKSLFRFESTSQTAELSGWIHVLFPYIEHGKGKLVKNDYLATWAESWKTFEARFAKNKLRGPTRNQLPPVIGSAPVKFIDQVTGVTHPLRFVSGMFGVIEDGEGAIRTATGWAVVHGDETGTAFDPIAAMLRVEPA